MGNSPSQPSDRRHPFSTNSVDPNDLTQAELLILLNERPLTIQEIKQAAAAARKQRHQSGQQQGGADGDDFSFYAQNGREEGDSEDIELAVKFHRWSQDLAQLRFRLVPAHLKEPVFWRTTFALLEERLRNRRSNNDGGGGGDDVSSRNSYDSTGIDNDDNETAFDEAGADSGSIDEDDEISLEDLLKKKDAQIRSLQSRIQTLESQLSSSSTDINGAAAHSGKWIVSQDSQNFLDFPEEVKTNMRREKQRRLKQVREEMKFIVDSDRIEDSHGQWDCCGQTEYRAVKCAPATTKRKK